jgi:diguanylate cyclase (GGDEF)-like protein
MKLYVVSSAYVNELEEVSRCLHKKILYIAMLILFLSLIVSAYYIRKLLQPIHELADTAEVIAKGNYNIRAIAQTDDEIGKLAKNFNIMVDTLQDHIQNLDKKVQEKTDALKSLAVTDPLTKLYNRRYFAEISTELFELAKRENQPLSLMMIDIDKFKNINDTYGHQIGDVVIEKLASVMSKMKRESDIACRYGGEEFILLLPKTSKDGATKLADRIRETIEYTKVLTHDSNKEVSFTISVGVSEVDFEKDTNIEAVIKRADDAMYKAKKTGRNRVCSL